MFETKRYIFEWKWYLRDILELTLELDLTADVVIHYSTLGTHFDDPPHSGGGGDQPLSDINEHQVLC